MNEEEWELICNGCGICCFEKVNVDGEIKVTDISCSYLNPYNHKCTIYNKRFKVNPKCLKLTPDNIHLKTWLPETCGYKHIAKNIELKVCQKIKDQHTKKC